MKPRSRSLDPFANLHTRSGPTTTTAANTSAPWLNSQTGVRPNTMPASAMKPQGFSKEPQAKPDQSVLEAKYPGMAQAVTLLWGHPEMNAYFERIWMADNVQTPLHPEAMAELMLLARIHQNLKPQRPIQTLTHTNYGSEYKLPMRRDRWEGSR